MKYLNDKKEIPIFESGRKERYTTKQAVDILFRQASLVDMCSAQPLGVRQNMSFLINISKLSNWKDIKADRNGVYDGVLRCGVWTVSCDASQHDTNFEIIAKKKQNLIDDNQFHLTINSKRNKATPGLVRSIFLLTDRSGKFVNDACLLQYHISTGEDAVEVQVKPHGNRKEGQSRPFHLTAKSTLDKIHEGLSDSGSIAKVYRSVMGASGGPSRASNPSVLPRGRKQVSNVKFARSSADDPVNDLLIYARHKEDSPILHHSDFPTDTWVLGTEVMCSDISRFTTSENLSYPLSIDPTFNMGPFEVTPVVYKHLFLKSRRTGENPIFLGPTMLHHRKTSENYRILSSVCATNIKNLNQAKGFVTDGEEPLIQAWSAEIPKAKHLRCFKHFEGNCKEKLRKIGICSAKDQKKFLNKVFGVYGKEEGILDAEDKKDLKNRLQASKEELDREERAVLAKDDAYQCKFWKYLELNYKMMKDNMVAKVRRQAGLKDGPDGKPIRSYTNPSESMNHVMSTFKKGVVSAKDGKENGLTKLEFTTSVFEEINLKQEEELRLAIARISEEYDLSEFVSHLAVSTDKWFGWNTEEREKYVSDMNKMSVEDAMNGKCIREPDVQPQQLPEKEFTELSVDVARFLDQNMRYKTVTARHVAESALLLLNHPFAIKEQPTLQPTSNKFDVAAIHAKNGRVQCTVNTNFVSCNCPSYKFDNICKHSIAVAQLKECLEEHLNFVVQKSKSKFSKSALAEAYVDKQRAGKKGGRNKNKYRPSKQQSTAAELPQSSTNGVYTELHHNDNPFVVRLLPAEAKQCKTCKVDFCHRQRHIPFDLVLEHKERWYFPKDGDWNNKCATRQEGKRFYHPNLQKCLKPRFPYIS